MSRVNEDQLAQSWADFVKLVRQQVANNTVIAKAALLFSKVLGGFCVAYKLQRIELAKMRSDNAVLKLRVSALEDEIRGSSE